MQRTTAVTVGLLFALGVALVLVLGRGSGEARPPKPSPHAKASASATAPLPSASAVASATPPPLDAGTDAGGEAAFDTLPDGRKVPELPASAPKTVTFGVVLVTYQGAQSAPASARSKTDAEKRARALLDEAKKDFAAAVGHGDPGSRSDMGRIPRGILEPAIEYLLFSLEKGGIHPDPIDTPRGFWIVRRND
jgi:hypothetical protein